MAPPSESYIGNHTIRISSILNNSLQTKSELDFTLSVIKSAAADEADEEIDELPEIEEEKDESSDEITFNPIKPSFELQLADQTVTVGGQSLAYPITFVTTAMSSQNFTMLVNLEMATKLEQLIVFNDQEGQQENVVKINANKLSEEDVGFYSIRVTAAFMNGD